MLRVSPDKIIAPLSANRHGIQHFCCCLPGWRQMPGMDGVESTRVIRERYSNETTVIILTAFSWDDVYDEAIEAGVDGFLAKPLFVSNMVEELVRITNRSNTSLFQEKKRASLEGRRILLAEDMEINAEIMMDLLEIEEIEADHAINGQVAVEMFDSSEPGTGISSTRLSPTCSKTSQKGLRGLNTP